MGRVAEWVLERRKRPLDGGLGVLVDREVLVFGVAQHLPIGHLVWGQSGEMTVGQCVTK